MASENPFAEFRASCETALRNTLNRVHPETMVAFSVESPPSSEFGELSSTVCFELGRIIGKKPLEIARQIVESIDLSGFDLVKNVKAAGGGYVNFYVNLAQFAKVTLESALSLDLKYGFIKTEEAKRIIVEHTSANPVHPIHVGTARNPVLGDSLARILTARGHEVFRHYYVDDVGRQAAVTAYGYEKLGAPQPKGKPDHFIGTIYAITSCIVEIKRLKKAIEAAKDTISDETSKWQRELDKWIAVAAEREAAHPELFAQLLNAISQDENPDAKIAELNVQYEKGGREAKELIRGVSELCLEGFKESFRRIGIDLDSWDWESDFVWNGSVKKALDQLSKTPYVSRIGPVLEFNADKAAQDLNLKPLLGLRDEYEVPSLTLTRADGTTLYSTRDIAYNLWKFEKADKIINVIGMEQSLSQTQLRIAIAALGHLGKAKNLQHFAYSLVRLPDSSMSGRTGQLITLDEAMDEAIRRAYEEVTKRSPSASEKEKQAISNFVGIGAIKYTLVQVDPSKPVVFTWDRVLDFEKNSAPYLQYSHARACSILRKAARQGRNPDYSLLKEPIEHDLILVLAQFPDVFIDSAENLRPNQIADYTNGLADKFNTFYGALPVLKAQPSELGDARLKLVEATKIVLRNALNLIGIEAPEKM